MANLQNNPALYTMSMYYVATQIHFKYKHCLVFVIFNVWSTLLSSFQTASR